MGEKKNGNKKGRDGEKNEKGSSAIVFKVDCLCDGCAIKVLKCIREVQGVETVTTESSSNKVTVTGAVDPAAIKEKLVKKTKKNVDLISPQPKKDDNKEEKEKKAEKEKNQDSGNDNGKKSEKKPKEAPVTTADLKVQPYCQCWGCTVKIRKIVADTKGVHELKVDKVKELVTVKGTMDVKALAEALKDKLKKKVEIVPLKKEKDGKNDGGENGGCGDGGKGKKKNNKGGNGGAGDGGNDAAPTGGGGGNGKMEGARMEYMVQPQFGYMPSYPGYGHPAYGYGYGHQHGHGYPGYVPGYPVSVHPPHHLFNDENPNACASM
ncbi:AMP-dependent synthetase and ligase family protein isoform 1 [Hibiscus syriacus]|uniref:AMP-dependent synthetase and ligase family protein isoform 1 n=1 Tax=Hibiscus syriacus TaxID=106335 RepID=A0A6A2ZLM0_HIBSY|nr:heavy metal-associated isoprenylated plant protein 3-like [Hibiscus syriacus]KAE8692901.1 AMP-dependent synthetase and ligase family protein isoform 1 [Hibiscus syriacus]